MKAPILVILSIAVLHSPVFADETMEKQAEALVTDATKNMRTGEISEVWKSFSPKSRNALRLSMLGYLTLQKELGEKHPEKQAAANQPEPTPFEKLQLEHDPEARRESEERLKAIEDPTGNYIQHMLQQWGFKTTLEETAKLSNAEFWKIFVEHVEDRSGDAYHPFMAKDSRLETWRATSKTKPENPITSVKVEGAKFMVETTVPKYDYFHGSYRALFLVSLPIDPKEKDKERIPFTWSGTIQGNKLELDVPPQVLENFRKWNEELNRRLQEP